VGSQQLETPYEKNVGNIVQSTTIVQERLTEIFGGYKAEWLKGKLFALFTEPSYFPELQSSRPCIIFGGRGTGKTTVLRGLSYQGQYALCGHDASKVSSWPFYGMYYRANTNIVTAFRGPELTEDQWVPYFAHYFNLLLCDLVLNFLEWYQLTTAHSIALNGDAFKRIAASVNIDPPSSLRSLSQELTNSRIAFEAFINNVVDKKAPLLTAQAAPLDTLVSILTALPEFGGKTFFFLIDEYENFEPYQQQVINTLIKHSGEGYTFKLCVKDLGIRRRTTLNPSEQLISPADYFRFDISERLSGDNFKQFALEVCNKRILDLKESGVEIVPDIAALLPGLTEEEEAERQGVDDLVADTKTGLMQDARLRSVVSALSPLKLFFFMTWANANEQDSLSGIISEYATQKGRVEWDTRFENYKYALLFELKQRKRGIRKYYCGWDTFIHLAASNIRYLLELVEQSLLLHVNSGESLNTEVSQETQTKAAQGVGKKNLFELEGLAVSGAHLTKLLLGLGRIFQQMAERSVGRHAPEVDQFRLASKESPHDSDSASSKVAGLLESAVMHLALLRFAGTKPGAETDTRDFDYTVHPIFSAFFAFSYRRKRKMMLTPEDLLGLINAPNKTIRAVLRRNNREEEPLPEQLEIFRAYYRES